MGIRDPLDKEGNQELEEPRDCQVSEGQLGQKGIEVSLGRKVSVDSVD